MPIYAYKAIDNTGSLLPGAIEADSENGAIAILIQRGLTPVEISDMSKKSDKPFANMKLSPSSEDLLFFVRNFGVALKSGVTVIAALDIMERDTTRPFMREMISEVGASVRGGSTLSDAFVPYAQYFTPAFIGLLRAGETSGSLGNAFLLIGEYLKREFNLKQRLKSALIYPVILVVASVLVVALLMIFVLPKLSSAFAQSGVKLPLITKIVLAISNVFTYSIWLDVFILLIIIGLIIWFKRSSIGRESYQKFLEAAPISNKMVNAVATVRFLRTLGNLLRSGVPIIEALNTTAHSVGHFGMEKAILDIEKHIEGGGRLSDGLDKYPKLFSPIIVGLVRVGEETGKLGDVLVEVSEFYDEELNNALKNAMALLEPVLLLFMGVIVGVIALSVLLPIYQLVSKLA